MHILVVDDHKDSRDILRDFLQSKGWQVDEAVDGLRALERIGERGPDLIVSDVLMPHMDGLTLCQKIKTDPRWADIPFVIYTATFVSEDDRRLALDLGAASFVVKPADFDDLLEIFQSFFVDGDAVADAGRAPAERDLPSLSQRSASALSTKLVDKLSELEDYRRTLATLMANLPGMAYRCRYDAQWTMEFVSEGAMAVTGFTPQALVGNHDIAFASLIHPDDRERVRDKVKQAVEDQKPYQMEYRLCRQDGQEGWVWEQGRCVSPPGQEPGILEGFITDISESKALRRQRDVSEERLRLALGGAGVGLWDWDMRSDGIHYSPTWAEMVGLQQQELGHDLETWSSRVHPDDLPAARQRVEACLADPTRPYESIFRFRHRDGRYLWVMARGNLLVDADGKPYRFIGTHTDITELKQTQESLRESRRKVADALMQTIRAVGNTIEKRDPYTAGHQRRVADLAAGMAERLGLDANRVTGIRMGGEIHDIGKISIPSEFLSRPGRLSDAEFEVIKTHSQAGADILQGIDLPWPIRDMVLQHHERLDGSGYPHGLQGQAICLEARILSVADVVEAMASHRPYRPGLGVQPALSEIERGRGGVYDAAVVDACLYLFREADYRFPD
jgi:PAS domain S-box-containing protein/putative nucleotidyltransferase with HDIG domain